MCHTACLNTLQGRLAPIQPHAQKGNKGIGFQNHHRAENAHLRVNQQVQQQQQGAGIGAGDAQQKRSRVADIVEQELKGMTV